MDDTSAPQIGFKVEALDEDGNVIATVERTRPEVRNAVLEGVEGDSLNVRLTVTDVYGNEVKASGKVN